MAVNRKILIKGMVCDRCIHTVRTALEKTGFMIDDIQLGEVTLSGSIRPEDAAILEEKLTIYGFSLLENKRDKIVQQVKGLLNEVYSGDFDFPYGFRFSELATKRLGMDYEKISTVFSESENTTLEKYLISYRTEKIKEMLVYTDDTLSDISFKLNFSSVAHLSRQFKQQTGLTPSYFREMRKMRMTG